MHGSEVSVDKKIIEDIKIPFEKLEKYNEIEKDLYLRMAVLDYQYEKYNEVKNVVWVGSSLDILAETLLYNSLDAVNDDFVSEMIFCIVFPFIFLTL